MRIFVQRSSGLPIEGLRYFEGYSHGFEDCTDRPSPTIDTKPRLIAMTNEAAHSSMKDHPPYRVPTMEEVRALPWNGFNVVSTFSGGGGSCTGYRMAGYRVLWANEFIEAARDTYSANHTTSILDGRDIRTVSPESILETTGLAKGELDLFDGSPPCSAFSTAGKREKGWGKAKSYSDDAVQVVDDLFFEYTRLVRGLKPKVFVAENVSGLVKGTAKGYFLNILSELKSCGYNVKAKLLDASWLGVPQARQRIIFIGVREDLGIEPAFPKPMGFQYTIRDAIPWIESVSGRTGPKFSRVESELDRPMNAILVQDPAQTRYEVCGPIVEPEAWMTRHATGKEWARIPVGGQSEKYFQLCRPDPDRPIGTVTASGGNAGLASVAHPFECRKFSIEELKRICSFPDDYVLTGTYAQKWERCGRSVPPLMMKAIAKTVA